MDRFPSRVGVALGTRHRACLPIDGKTRHSKARIGGGLPTGIGGRRTESVNRLAALTVGKLFGGRVRRVDQMNIGQ
jgi:hypothetical protein